MCTYKSHIEWTAIYRNIGIIIVDFPLVYFNSRLLDVLRTQNTKLDSVDLLLGLSRIVRFQIWVIKESDLFHFQ